ncbi:MULTISPECIES: DUF485 domain-containing protein [unclassified Virgibacillus]|uniref:DUF485 domain-containing protein n=1 Tax=unclassified Virgibacillus TaxID=2620237 RepID=UPI0024DEFB05|nr:DUF485 domain-containing protein [Virgibacillus sp. LDC-1]
MLDEHVAKLIDKKKRFVLPMLVFLFAFYFMLPLSLAFFPDVMNSSSVVFQITWGWLYAFLQIPMTWIVGWLYCRNAKQLDQWIEERKQEVVS